jgi:hypothetical protein
MITGHRSGSQCFSEVDSDGKLDRFLQFFKDLFCAKLNRFITLFLIYFMSLMIAYFYPIKKLFIFW